MTTRDNNSLICPSINGCNVYREYAQNSKVTAQEDVIYRIGRIHYCLALTQKSPDSKKRTASCGCLNLTLLNTLEFIVPPA